MSSDWDTAKAQAVKLLGKEGKLPKLRVDPNTMIPALIKAWEGFHKLRDELGAQLLTMQDEYSKASHIIKQCIDTIDGDDFGLDAKKDKKLIDQVTDVLLKGLNSINDGCDENISELGKLDRAIIDMRRLKQVKI